MGIDASYADLLHFLSFLSTEIYGPRYPLSPKRPINLISLSLSTEMDQVLEIFLYEKQEPA